VREGFRGRVANLWCRRDEVNNPRLAFVSMGITESAWRGSRKRYVDSRRRRANHSLSDPTMSCIRHWHEVSISRHPLFEGSPSHLNSCEPGSRSRDSALTLVSWNPLERRTSWFTCTPMARLKPTSPSGRRPPRLSNNDVPCPYHDPI